MISKCSAYLSQSSVEVTESVSALGESILKTSESSDVELLKELLKQAKLVPLERLIVPLERLEVSLS